MPNFNNLENIWLDLFFRNQLIAINMFRFQSLKKAIKYCVIPTMAYPTLTSDNHFIESNQIGKLLISVLNAAVRMKYQTFSMLRFLIPNSKLPKKFSQHSTHHLTSNL
jgi:hypothetical protein